MRSPRLGAEADLGCLVVQMPGVGWDFRYRQHPKEGLPVAGPGAFCALTAGADIKCVQRAVRCVNAMYSALESQKSPSLRTFIETSFIF